MSTNDLIRKNTILNTIKSICSIIFPLITFPYISRALMVDSVGKVNFGSSIVSYFSLISSFGINTYAIKECARNRDDREHLSKVASEIFSINICSTLLAYIALIITLIFGRNLSGYRELIIIQSTSIIFTTIGADWVNSAMEDFQYITIRTIVFQIISIILMILFVHYPEDYLNYALITVLSSSGSNILNVYYRKKYCDIRFVFKMNLKAHIFPILSFFSMVLAQQIYVNSDITILGLIKGDYEVGLYSTSVKIYNITNSIIASISTVVWPQIAEAYKEKRQKDVNQLAKYSLSFITTLGLPSIIGINVVAKESVIIIAGESFVEAKSSLHILTIALLFSFIGGWLGSTNFLPNGKEKICIISSSVAAIVNIVFNLILIPFWGQNAAAITTSFSEFIAVIILILCYDKKMKIEGIWKLLLGPLLGCIFIVASSFIIHSLVDSIIASFVLIVFVSVVGYLSILILVKNEFVMNFIVPVSKVVKRRIHK